MPALQIAKSDKIKKNLENTKVSNVLIMLQDDVDDEESHPYRIRMPPYLEIH